VKIIYLHGFASNGDSEKSQALKIKFGDNNVYSPDLPLDADEVTKMVSEYVHSVNDYPVIFVGTSLGGFYANYFAQKFDCPCVLVNPSVNPGKSLSKHLGVHKRYNSDLSFELTQDHLDKWSSMSDDVSNDSNGKLINLFIALDDDVINAKDMLDAFPHYNYLKTFDKAGHRFLSNWNEVVEFIETLG
jgi:predicted esterase YcpF (UPF0227 family)